MRRGAGADLVRPAGAAALAIAVLVLAPSALPAAGDTILTAAGNGVRASAGDGGPATMAALDRPRSVAPTRDGGYVWTEPFSSRVRSANGAGIVTTIAGNGGAGFSGDRGRAKAAELNFVLGAAQLADGGFVLADSSNHRVRRASPEGTITTAVGTGEDDYNEDGIPATQAEINNPRGVAALPDGGFLIADTGNHRIRNVRPDGTISTVAGTGRQGFSGDGGPATAAMPSSPFGVAPTSDGGLPRRGRRQSANPQGLRGRDDRDGCR